MAMHDQLVYWSHLDYQDAGWESLGTATFGYILHLLLILGSLLLRCMGT